MKHKFTVVLLIMLLFVSMLPSVALADTPSNTPTFKYTNWYYNDDFTKITINGKTYDNYIMVTRWNDALWLQNMAADYLCDPYLQQEMTPDEFFAQIKEKVFTVLETGEAKYPVGEVISINYKPWQAYPEFKEFLVERFEHFYDNYHQNLNPKDKFFEFLKDPSNNGYAYEVFVNKKSIGEAKKTAPVEKMKIETHEYYLCKTFKEYQAIGSTMFGNEITETSLGTLLNRMKQPYPVVGETAPEKIADTVVILHLNSKNVAITKKGVTNNVTLDVSPYCPRGTTLIPVRGVLEAFGADVKWIPEKQQVRVTKGDMDILLTIGSKIALVNGKQVTMLEPAQIVNGRTMIPLRFVSENLGYTVKWYGDEQKILIYR